MKNISISLDDELFNIVEEILKNDKTKRSRSSLITESLFEYILSHYPSILKRDNNQLGPSILSQLKYRKKNLKGPSFRYARKLNIKMEPWKKVE